VSAGGYEYNLVLLAAVFGLTENGPGKWSVDDALGRSRWGTRWALAALAAGAAGSAAVLRGAKQEVEKDIERPAAGAEPVTAASSPTASSARIGVDLVAQGISDEHAVRVVTVHARVDRDEQLRRDLVRGAPSGSKRAANA
jgi:hypothetical protein